MALPSSVYPATRVGNISAIWLTISLYSAYSAVVNETFSPKLLTPVDKFSYLSANFSAVEALSFAVFNALS